MQKQLTIKIMTITIIGLLLLVPINMVQTKLYERQQYLEQAKSTVASSWTGQQRIITPLIVIPYELSHSAPPSGFYPADTAKFSHELGIVLPSNVSGNIAVHNKSVFKGIYEIPVFNSDIHISGLISAEQIQQHIAELSALPRFHALGKPYLSFQISDMRGITNTPTLLINEQSTPLNPGAQLAPLSGGLHSNITISDDVEDISFSLNFSLRGMGSFSFIPLADNTEITLQSDWPHPEFIGASLPMNRDISSTGFTATWTSNLYSNNAAETIRQCIEKDQCHPLINSASGVNFIEPVDIYLQSERSVKYALLFVGLSFITFFIFETIKQTRIHPIQYALVGFAIAVFYLLLISLAEHIAFHWAYAIAAACCNGLMLFYVRYMLRSFRSALSFSVMIAMLYALLYVIIQAEDFALLMGAFLVFVVLTVVMFTTRKFDWYDVASTAVEK
ncbi:cell envelope integrity protein CreD [Gammaproteobacteria bacterium 45_16_T64]|nr:cell envelope integrity protein CreD [Gammaproteobacteria bacterium 45_16_T64]